MKPWRYDFEYARAWRELRFPLIGISTEDKTQLRMGGKGRAGRLPPRPLRYLPAGLWTDLTSLGVFAQGDAWAVQLESRAPVAEFPPGWLEQQCRNYARRRRRRDGEPLGDPRTRPIEISVDGTPKRFEGCEIDGLWVGSTTLPEVSVSAVTFGIDPEALSLITITDPSDYLKGQRDFMKR